MSQLINNLKPRVTMYYNLSIYTRPNQIALFYFIYKKCMIVVAAGGKTIFVLHKIDAIDDANLGYDYSIVGGTGLDETLEKVTFETKVVPGLDGGSIGKVSVKYHTKGDAALSDAVRAETKAKGDGLFKAIEGYVLANPDY